MAAPRSPLDPRIAVAAALGLAAAGLIAFALWGDREGAEEAAAVPVAPTVAPAAPTVAATALPKSPTPAPPSLDLVRVEPDGAAMLAGRAAPGAEVTIRAGETVLATAEADASGAFVANFDAAPDGPRDLTVSAGGAGAPELALTLPEPEGGFVPAAGEAPAEPAPTLAEGPAPTPESAPGSAVEPAPTVVAPPVEVAAVTPVPAAAAPRSAPATPAPTPASTPASTIAGTQSAPLPRPASARLAGAGAATVVVQPGGTLWTLAREHYGAGRRYPAIVSANADEISDPALIFPGQRLVLPPAGRSD